MLGLGVVRLEFTPYVFGSDGGDVGACGGWADTE